MSLAGTNGCDAEAGVGSGARPDFAVVALFAVLGLLICFYLIAHFPLSVEDAAFFYLLS